MGNSTLVNLKKREIIKQIRQENQKLIYDERYLNIQEKDANKQTQLDQAESEALKILEQERQKTEGETQKISKPDKRAASIRATEYCLTLMISNAFFCDVILQNIANVSMANDSIATLIPSTTHSERSSPA